FGCTAGPCPQDRTPGTARRAAASWQVWWHGAKSTILARRESAGHAMKYIAHFGYNGAAEVGIVKRYAEDLGYSYKWQGLGCDMFRAATMLKHASMAVIWN